MLSQIGKWYPSTKLMIVVSVIIISMFSTIPTVQYVLFGLSILLSLCSGTLSNFLRHFLNR